MGRHGPLHVHAEAGEADALADAEGMRRDEDDPGEDVADGLLRREPDDHGGKRGAYDEGGGVETGDPQADQQDRDEGDEPDQKAGDPSRPGLEPPHQHRLQRPTQAPRQRPTGHDQRPRGGQADGLVESEELDPIAVRDPDHDQQRDQDDELLARPARRSDRLPSQGRSLPADRRGEPATPIGADRRSSLSRPAHAQRLAVRRAVVPRG